MQIGIIGTGNMGRSLGVAWAHAGHSVFFGARDAAKAAAAAQLAGASAQSGSNDDAAAFGDVLVWNPRTENPADVLINPTLLDGKVVIDMNNGPVPVDLRFPPITLSFSERLAAATPRARIVKAFNTMAQEAFEHDAQTISAGGVSAFLAGDDEPAKAVVGALAKELGFTPVDVGALERAQMLESLGDFIRYMMIGMQRGVFATISLGELPATSGQRLGGRQASKLP